MEEQEAKNDYKKGGYGKRPLWFWIVIYLVIAAVAYFLIYYLFFRGSNSFGPLNY